MKLLLDTHTFMWFVDGNAQLHEHARRLMEQPNHVRLLSVASLWEMAIKASLGKLAVSMSFVDLIAQQVEPNGITLLPISPSHLDQVRHLSFPHRDPFDRLLIAQALVEEAVVISRDRIFDQYPITRAWAG